MQFVGPRTRSQNQRVARYLEECIEFAMSAIILDGEKIARKILQDVKKQVSKRYVQLAVIQVGRNLVSESYIRKKQEVAKNIGIDFKLVQLPESISSEKLKEEIQKIGRDPKVSGMIIQLPLPKHIHAKEILDRIPVSKDVDVLSSAAFEKFKTGKLPILPPTVAAVSALFSAYGIEAIGKKIVLVGSGRLVGLPLSIWLERQGVTIQVVNKETKDISSVCQEADILISGVGKTNLITGEMIKEGAVVVDAGTSVEHGKTKGDVDFESVAKKASYLTPVPGGVGPVTVACLFQNLLFLSQKK